MNKFNIKERDLLKKSHELRKKGVIPGTLYGNSIQNTPVKASVKDLTRALIKPGEIYRVNSRSGPVMVKFGEIQKHPVTNDLIHFSLVEMPKGVENEVSVPINLKGIPVGVKKGGVLFKIKDEVTLSGKPRNIPDMVATNISDLDIGEKIVIDDLNIPKKVDAIEGDSDVVAVCRPPTKATTAPDFPLDSDESEAEAENEMTKKLNNLNHPAEAI